MNSSERSVVLTVDDSHVMQILIRRVLSSEYRVLSASTAIEALAIMNNEPISVLLLDVTMPEIDGLELCRTIRTLSKFRHLPVIMVTAKDGAFDRVQGRLAGATEYLTKPFDANQLLQLVHQFAGARLLATEKLSSISDASVIDEVKSNLP